MAVIDVDKSSTLKNYRKTMADCIRLFIPNTRDGDIYPVIDYSINKRYKDEPCKITNSYTKQATNKTLLQVADYINNREPIVTAFGSMFKRHGTVPNPLAVVIQQFLDQRSYYKDEMLKFPKGSDEFEKYNLLQSLEKISVNGLYGVLGMYTSLIYNINVATSITSQGRALVSTMTMFFEAFLSNNVKYGSLNEVLESIKNIVSEEPKRKYRDCDILDRNITRKECFVKVVMSCGYRWIPTEDELEIIWMAVQNLSQHDLNRVYYKNNLYEFMSNSSMRKAIRMILSSLDKPFMNPNKPPKNVKPMLDELTDILKEFVYYRYMYIDRIDRCATMMKNVTLISDTDSTIVSLDAWYRFILDDIKDIDIPIKKVAVPPIFKIEFDEFGDIVDGSNKAIKYLEPDYDYDFFSDELIELEHCIDPTVILPQDNVRHSILNIISYVNTVLVNDYMEAFCFNTHSWKPEDKRKCKIYSKNEFTFQRALLTYAMKNYATLQEVQEGVLVPKDKQLDIKGIEALTKSTKAKSTREALQKILLEDIMRAPSIDQFKIVKDIAIFEKKIINSLYDGSREYYKPATIKSISSYENPMRIQGIKASVVWNALRDSDFPAINLDERNAVDIAKVKLDPKTVEKLKDKYPETYEKAVELMKDSTFKSGVDSIAIPIDSEVPGWLLELIDYTTIVNDNIGGFPYESVGIKRFDRKDINYTNILSL